MFVCSMNCFNLEMLRYKGDILKVKGCWSFGFIDNGFFSASFANYKRFSVLNVKSKVKTNFWNSSVNVKVLRNSTILCWQVCCTLNWSLTVSTLTVSHVSKFCPQNQTTTHNTCKFAKVFCVVHILCYNFHDQENFYNIFYEKYFVVILVSVSIDAYQSLYFTKFKSLISGWNVMIVDYWILMHACSCNYTCMHIICMYTCLIVNADDPLENLWAHLSENEQPFWWIALDVLRADKLLSS